MEKIQILGNTIVFRDGELSLDLSKYERDFEVKLDITENEYNQLQIGLSKKYVAQIIIPEREYKDVPYEKANDESVMETLIQKVAQPFNITKTIIETVEVK